MVAGDHTSTILVGKQHLPKIFEDLGAWEESEAMRLEIVALKRETLAMITRKPSSHKKS